MGVITNLDLFSVGTAVAATGILGFTIFYNNRRSITSLAFLTFCVATILWGVVNYLNYQLFSPVVALWLLRLTIFLGVCQAFSLFNLVYVFPKETTTFSKFYKYILFPVVITTAGLTLTPLVFNRIAKLSPEGKIIELVNGPGIAIFGIVVLSLVIGSIGLLIRNIVKFKNQERKQAISLLVGICLTFALLMVFNLILPAFFNNPNYIPLGALFIFPFIALTAYAILRHGLLNVKIVSTEVLVLVLAVATFVEVIISDSVLILILRSSIFLLVLGVGVLLIRSVIREVKQREELQVLTEQLGEANDKLQALDKARAEFISIASHQLRTPPATIKWYVGAIMDGDFGPLSEELKASLQRVESTNNSQISLIDDLLNASRIERGKLEFFFEMGDIEPLAKITVDQLLPQAQMHKLQLIYQPPSKPLPQVMLDKEKVRQVINNFIDNAIKYTKQGSITVHFEQTANDVEVRVTDTGRGVAPDVAPTLFEKYTRGKDAATAASGLGLGLYVAKVVIEQNNGKIWVESPGEGKGSTFAFSLPIHSTLESTSTVDLAQEQGGQPVNIASAPV